MHKRKQRQQRVPAPEVDTSVLGQKRKCQTKHPVSKWQCGPILFPKNSCSSFFLGLPATSEALVGLEAQRKAALVLGPLDRPRSAAGFSHPEGFIGYWEPRKSSVLKVQILLTPGRELPRLLQSRAASPGVPPAVATVLTFNLHYLIGVLHHLVLGLVAEGVSPGLDEVQDLTADTRLHLPLQRQEREEKKNISGNVPETQRINSLLLKPLKRNQKYHSGKRDLRVLRRGKSCQKPAVRTMHSMDNRPLQLLHCPLQHNQKNVLWSSTDQLNRAVTLMLRANAQQLCPSPDQSHTSCTQGTVGAPAAQHSTAHLACPLPGGCQHLHSRSTQSHLRM